MKPRQAFQQASFKKRFFQVSSKCVKCHNNVFANGGVNFSIECNIVSNKARIKIRAVDEGSMSPTGTLPLADKTTITNWMNAGGKYTD
jgi:uncharacterized membrane protein